MTCGSSIRRWSSASHHSARRCRSRCQTLAAAAVPSSSLRDAAWAICPVRQRSPASAHPVLCVPASLPPAIDCVGACNVLSAAGVAPELGGDPWFPPAPPVPRRSHRGARCRSPPHCHESWRTRCADTRCGSPLSPRRRSRQAPTSMCRGPRWASGHRSRTRTSLAMSPRSGAATSA